MQSPLPRPECRMPCLKLPFILSHKASYLNFNCEREAPLTKALDKNHTQSRSVSNSGKQPGRSLQSPPASASLRSKTFMQKDKASCLSGLDPGTVLVESPSGTRWSLCFFFFPLGVQLPSAHA